jgi:hypothetical protein
MTNATNETDARKRYPVPARVGMYACAECGCVDVQGTAWVKLNGDKLVDDEPPTLDYWCPACEDHHGWVHIVEAAEVLAGTAVLFSLEEPKADGGIPEMCAAAVRSGEAACASFSKARGINRTVPDSLELVKKRVSAAAEAQEIFGDELERHAAELRKKPAIRVAALQGLYDVLKEGHVDGSEQRTFARTLRDISALLLTLPGGHQHWCDWLHEKAKDIEEAIEKAEAK